MFQAIIAEDSKPIQRNLRALLAASGLPVEVAAAAANGEEALELCRRLPVDILITDIRMPKMDGLTLIDEAKKTHPGLKAVLVSGYNDFEYTRRALNLQVCDYLLKPVVPGELIEVMRRVVDRLQEERAADRSSVLDGIIDPAASVSPPLDTSILEEPQRLWVLRRQLFTSPTVRWDPVSIRSALAGAWGDDRVGVYPTRRDGEILILSRASIGEPSPPAPELLEILKRVLSELGLEASVAYSPKPAEPRQIPDQYPKLSRHLQERLTLGRPVVLDLSQPLQPAQPQGENIERLCNVYTEMIRRLQKDRFLLQLAGQLSAWKEAALPAAGLERFVMRLAGAFEGALPQAAEGGGRNVLEQAGRLLGRPSYGDFCSGLLALAGECFDELQASNRKSGSELFQKIDEHLRTNLYAQVTMNDLALKFHVSPSYISRIMKRYSQRTFVHHYLDLKIHEAKRLMEVHPQMFIKDISDALCFHDQHYFSKVFKEFAGCSPSEYRSAIRPTV
ncbi:response regulator [Paenibacillus sp. S-38]|uniref:response regulator n=1 Tax=Paenibacillus sp. S-38 TaxID=3416710 RepID=UPI003CEC6464